MATIRHYTDSVECSGSCYLIDTINIERESTGVDRSRKTTDYYIIDPYEYHNFRGLGRQIVKNRISELVKGTDARIWDGSKSIVKADGFDLSNLYKATQSANYKLLMGRINNDISYYPIRLKIFTTRPARVLSKLIFYSQHLEDKVVDSIDIVDLLDQTTLNESNEYDSKLRVVSISEYIYDSEVSYSGVTSVKVRGLSATSKVYWTRSSLDKTTELGLDSVTEIQNKQVQLMIVTQLDPNTLNNHSKECRALVQIDVDDIDETSEVIGQFDTNSDDLPHANSRTLRKALLKVAHDSFVSGQYIRTRQILRELGQYELLAAVDSILTTSDIDKVHELFEKALTKGYQRTDEKPKDFTQSEYSLMKILAVFAKHPKLFKYIASDDYKVIGQVRQDEIPEVFTPTKNMLTASFDSIVTNSERANLSIRYKVPGTLNILKSQAKKFELDPSIPCYRWKTQTLIRDGEIYQHKFKILVLPEYRKSLAMSEDDLRVVNYLLDSPGVKFIRMDEPCEYMIYEINLDEAKIPVAYQGTVGCSEVMTVDEYCKLIIDLNHIKAELKLAKFLVSGVESDSIKTTTPVLSDKSFTLTQSDLLKTYGLNPTTGEYTPSTVAYEGDTEEYEATRIKVSMKGWSSIPTIDKAMASTKVAETSPSQYIKNMYNKMSGYTKEVLNSLIRGLKLAKFSEELALANMTMAMIVSKSADDFLHDYYDSKSNSYIVDYASEDGLTYKITIKPEKFLTRRSIVK